MKKLMNLQGMTFTEAQAREHYGSRFETTQLVEVEVDEDGEVVTGQQPAKITAPGVRFGVRMTGRDGVFMKDMVSEHWTTYPVRDMTRKEADDVVARELAKGSCNTYEIIDLDEADQVRQIRSAAAKAVRDLAGYHSIPWEIRQLDDGLGAAIRRVAMQAADHAEAMARGAAQ